MEKFAYLRDVVTLALDQKKCVGCGMCLMVCPQEVLSMDNGSAGIENRDRCMECGACARNCPTEAITVKVGVGCAAALIRAVVEVLSGNRNSFESLAGGGHRGYRPGNAALGNHVAALSRRKTVELLQAIVAEVLSGNRNSFESLAGGGHRGYRPG